MPTLIEQAETLTQKAATLREEAEALSQKPNLSAEDLASVKKSIGEADDLDRQASERIELADTIDRNRVAKAGYAAPRPRKTAAGAGTEPIVARAAFLDDPMRGFKSHRDFLVQVMNAGRRGAHSISDNLKSLRQPTEGFQATAGADEQSTFSDTYGGFLTPKGVVQPGVLSLGFDADPFAGMVRKIPMTARRVEFNARVDKNHSTSVSGGLVVYRRAEAAAVTASRMQFEQVVLEANQLMGLAYATEEVLRESPESFAAMLESGFRDEFGAKALSERLGGSGVGCKLGVNVTLAASSLGPTIDVAKETNQPAATIVWANLLKMRMRCWGYGNAVWYANHDTLATLMAITQPGSTIPLFTQDAQGVERLFGRPIYFGEFAETLGTVGDILLANWGEYLEGEYEPIQGASSVHVRFIEHEQCFKFWKSDAGAPWWRTALTPRKGANTLSPFVRLATRA